MMKKQYQPLSFQLIPIAFSDFITTSLTLGGNSPNFGEEQDVIYFDP